MAGWLHGAAEDLARGQGAAPGGSPPTSTSARARASDPDRTRKDQATDRLKPAPSAWAAGCLMSPNRCATASLDFTSPLLPNLWRSRSKGTLLFFCCIYSELGAPRLEPNRQGLKGAPRCISRACGSD
jgi:hypothetical protein